MTTEQQKDIEKLAECDCGYARRLAERVLPQSFARHTNWCQSQTTVGRLATEVRNLTTALAEAEARSAQMERERDEAERKRAAQANEFHIRQNIIDNQRTELAALRSELEGLIGEMETIAMVAGQCSVEEPDNVKSWMAAAESARCAVWAARLAHLTHGEKVTPKPRETCTSCDGDGYGSGDGPDGPSCPRCMGSGKGPAA